MSGYSSISRSRGIKSDNSRNNPENRRSTPSYSESVYRQRSLGDNASVSSSTSHSEISRAPSGSHVIAEHQVQARTDARESQIEDTQDPNKSIFTRIFQSFLCGCCSNLPKEVKTDLGRRFNIDDGSSLEEYPNPASQSQEGIGHVPQFKEKAYKSFRYQISEFT